MAGPWFVRSAAVGTADGLSWTNAKTTLGAAATASSAGDTFWVSDDHNEQNGSATTITFPGTAANPNLVYCADHTVASPGTGNLKTTGVVSTTTTNALTVNGNAYIYGLSFIAGSGANSASLALGTGATTRQVFDTCLLKLGGSNGGSFGLATGATGLKTEFWNSNVQGSATNFSITPSDKFIWRGGTISGATLPTTLFAVASRNTTYLLEGCDLSPLGSGATLFAAYSATGDINAVLVNCKLGASVTVAGTPLGPASRIVMIRCDSGATNYRSEIYDYLATLVTETSIVRTGGATDGTTPISHKIVTTANSKWVQPFEEFPITLWNTVAGSSITVVMYGTWNSGSVPNNDDIWFDVDYLSASTSPLGSFATATKANNLATGSALTADGSTWGGGGSGAGWSPFSMSVTFTPQMVGPLTLYVKAAKASSTFYIDPKPSISGVTVSKSFITAPGAYTNELSTGSSGMLYLPNLDGV